MRLQREHNDFIRFLKDEKFIQWKLFPNDELRAYWEDFLEKFPDERKNFELAEEHFRHINLSSYKLPEEKKQEAIRRLEHSLARYARRQTLRRFTYAAAACAAALVLSLLYIQKSTDWLRDNENISAGYIVGSELESKDILFITGGKTASFQENVDIEIDNERTAQIKAGDNTEEKIAITQNTMNKLIVPYGKRSKIVLPDGTQVWLNSGSSLEFPSDFSGKTRDVYLSGEIYIEVAHDTQKPFRVHASGFDVKVYGTQFNVTAYPNSQPSVVLVQGSVSLQSENKPEIFLSPSEQALYSESGVFQTKKVDITPFISWKNGYLTFEDTPVIEALKQIERYYNLSFNFDEEVSFQGLTCTGKIILSDNLDNVMTTLALISSTTYKKGDTQIYIYKK